MWALSLYASSAAAGTLTMIGGTPYTIPGLDGHIFYEDSEVTGLSGDGSTVIGMFGGERALRWNRQSGFAKVAIQWADSPIAGIGMEISAVSDDGTVFVGDSKVDTPRESMPILGQLDPRGSEATRWTERDGKVTLGDLPGGIYNSAAHAVSAHGEVIVGTASTFSGGSSAARWTTQGGLESLEGDVDTYANGISADGRVVIGQGFRCGVVWEQGFAPTDIGDLPGGGNSSFALAVSADGTTVVGYSGTNIGGEAIRWTRATGIERIDLAPGGVQHSQAVDVTANGSLILGQATIGDPRSLVFLWSQHMGMKSIRALLDERGIDSTGWTFEQAVAISNDGQVMVGNGHYLNRAAAWLVDFSPVPEPDTANLACVSMTMCFVFWRRRRLSRKSCFSG
jgi:uncharacterized membrane protein